MVINMLNRFVLVVTAPVLALSTLTTAEPLLASAAEIPNEVSAFLETTQDWVDNAEAIVNLDADIDYYLPLGFVSAYLQNVRDAYAADKEVVLTLVQGQCYYRLVGSSTIYPCSCYAVATPSGVLAASQHFRISYDFEALTSGADLNMYAQFNLPYYQVGGSASTGYVRAQWRDDLDFFVGTPSVQDRAPYGVQISAEVRNEIPTLSSGSSLGTVALVGGLNTVIDFPSGSASKAIPWEYYNEVLIPYLQSEYPDTPAPLMPSPYNEPVAPVYPTDFVTGMPKEWTVENPQLPDVTRKHLTLPEFSWDSIDLSGLQEVSHGVGFWWALLGKIFTDFHLFPIAILVVALSVVGFILWKLGG